MSKKTINAQTANSNIKESERLSKSAQRQFIHVETAQNSRLNKGRENNIDTESNARRGL